MSFELAPEALRQNSPRLQGTDRRLAEQRGQRSLGSSRRDAAKLGDASSMDVISLLVRNPEIGATHLVSGCLSSAIEVVTALSH